MSSDSVSVTPFGKYKLPWWSRLLIDVCQRLPANKIGKQLAFILRKPVLKFHADPLDVTVDGLKLRLFPSENLSDKRLLSTPFMLDGIERQELVSSLPKGATVVDVGANVGGYSVLLLKDRPDLNVLAIEADPDTAERLNNNIQLNQLKDRCKIVTKAVSDRSAHVKLYRNPDNQGKNSLEENSSIDGDYVSVSCCPLLKILDDASIDRADHIKLDIEGHEHTALSAFFLSAAPYRWPTTIQIEQHRNEELNDAVQLCLNRGYRVRLRTRMNVLLERIAAQLPDRIAS